ncbi:hypothetical protein ACVBGC_17175 [Burkholderia stagnalis]
MKRMLLGAVALVSMLGVAHAQTQTFHFGEGQTQVQGAAPSAPSAGRPATAAPSRHYRRAAHKRRHPRGVKPTRGGIYTHS